jgi:thioredoxin reductase (NADPH)
MTTQYETDIVIIGAGPVGLFSIFEAGMLKMRCHVVDTLESVGGQCAALYPEKPIYDIPAHPKIEAIDLIRQLEEQAAPFKPVFHLGQQVVGVQSSVVSSNSQMGEASRPSEPSAREAAPHVSDSMSRSGGNYIVTTSVGTNILCKAIIIAAGCGAFGPNRPPLEGLEAFEGKSVFYMVTQKESLRGKRIAIAGGGDSAVDWALLLADIAEHIYFIHRRPKFRAAPESVAQLEALAKQGKVEFVVPYQLAALEGENGQLSRVVVEDLKGQKKSLDAQVLLPFFGLAMELGPIAEWGLNLELNNIAVNPATCETNQQGIFAVGDIATYPGKLKLILCGFSEAAMACHAAYPLVHAGKALHFKYSTSKGVA